MLSDTYYWHFLQLASSKIKKLEVKIYIPQFAESFSAIYNTPPSTVLMWDRMKVLSYFSEIRIQISELQEIKKSNHNSLSNQTEKPYYLSD